MSAETMLDVGYLVWTLVTAGILVAYRTDRGARLSAWRRIGDQRRKQQEAWRLIRELRAELADSRAATRLDAYLRDGSSLYVNDEED